MAEKPLNGSCCGAPGVRHQMRIAGGHFKGMMPQKIGDHGLSLAAHGQPGSIGVAQRMEDHPLTPILDPAPVRSAVSQGSFPVRGVEAQLVHGAIEAFGNAPHEPAAPRREKQGLGGARGQLCQGVRHVFGHDRVPGLTALGFPDTDAAGGHIDIPGPESRDFAETQAALQTDQSHQPGLTAAFFQGP